ncbi:MAG: tetratricopeptide repeat protein [Calditrichaeota bacterium]|nr:tetratricopeptide repeat protein [Calditrichota bacterium]
MRKIFPIIMVILGGCASLKFQEDISDYRNQITSLLDQLRQDQSNAEIHRDLGVIYFRTAHYDTARYFLYRAYSEDSTDAKTILYYGLSLEFDRNEKEALAVYEKFTNISGLSPYKNLIESRYVFLRRQLLREEMRQLVRKESEISGLPVSGNTLAVFPFAYTGSNPRYLPLGKGLSEMILIDLDRITDLQLVERVRIQALLDELKFARSEYVEPSQAPRAGRFLGAGQIIGGSFTVFNNKQTRVDATYWNVYDEKAPVSAGSSQLLSNFFRIEKDLVFQIAEAMGIQLTPEQREEIDQVPTKNLEAFLQYCLGLEYEDSGDFQQALQYYSNAVKLDESFSGAQEKTTLMKNLQISTGSSREVADAANALEEGFEVLPDAQTSSLVDSRLSTLGSNINSNFVPGDDKTYSAEEAENAGVGAELPLPPGPPDR